MSRSVAKGFEENKRHHAAVSALGKPLARRARSRCELCEEAGVSLRPLEVTPSPPEPDQDHAVLLCASCVDGVKGGAVDSDTWRFLEGVVWSDLPPLQVTAVRMLRRLAGDGVEWASDALDGLYLDPEIEEWVAAARA